MPAFGARKFASEMERSFPLCENISIDYAVLEKAKQVAGIAAAEAEPPADVGLLFEHVYAAPPASFAAELAELRELLDG